MLEQAQLFYKGTFCTRREEGIRTLDTLLTHTRFPSVRLKPLGHLSNKTNPSFAQAFKKLVVKEVPNIAKITTSLQTN